MNAMRLSSRHLRVGGHHAPAHLFPLEAEREVVSGALRAAAILHEEPQHRGARAAIVAVLGVDTDDFSQKPVGSVIAGIQSVFAEHGSLSIGALLQELRRRREAEGVFRALEASYDYGLAPVDGMVATIDIVRRAASDRRAYAAHLDAAATLHDGVRP